MSTVETKIKMPFVRQRTDYFCGQASLEMIFKYHNKNKTQEDLAKIMNTREKIGTKNSSMIDAVKSFGFHFCAKENSLINEIDIFLKNNIPVIVNYIEPSDEISHYAVAVGLNKKEIILNDPWNGNNFKLSKKEFLRRWYGFPGEGKKWLLAVCSESFSHCACKAI